MRKFRHDAVLCLVLALGCSRPASSGAPAAGQTSTVVAAQEPAAAVSLAETAGPATPTGGLTVGYTHTPVSEAANAQNDKALGLLKKGKLPEAVAEFKRTLEAAPGYLLARYNLACAEARMKDFTAASATLTQVFEADFLGFRAGYKQDTDLAEFLKSSQGIALVAREAEFEAAFQAAISNGVRLMALSPGAVHQNPNELQKSVDEQMVLAPRGLRIGVWNATTKRFIPVGPRTPSAVTTYIGNTDTNAIVIGGSPNFQRPGDLSPVFGAARFDIVPWNVSGTALVQKTVSAGNFANLLVRAASAQLEVFDSTQQNERYFVRYRSSGGQPVVATAAKESDELKDSDKSVARGSINLWNHAGYTRRELAAGYSVVGGIVVGPANAKYSLPKSVFGMPAGSIVESPSKSELVVVLEAHSCGNSCNGGFTAGAHVVFRVDVASQQVIELARGTGAGAARYAANGTLYVQTESTVRSWTNGNFGEALPTGLLLASPLLTEKGMACCGPL